MTEYVSARPYTQGERERDEEERKKAEERNFIRRKTLPSRQNYNRRGTPALRRAYDRLGGN